MEGISAAPAEQGNGKEVRHQTLLRHCRPVRLPRQPRLQGGVPHSVSAGRSLPARQAARARPSPPFLPSSISGKASQRTGSAGEVMFGTDSHTCNAGAFGQFASGVGNTDAGFILGTGKLLIKVPPTLRFVLDGQMPSYLMAKDLILHIIGEITVAGTLPLLLVSQLSVTLSVLLLTLYLPHCKVGPIRPWSSAAKPSRRCPWRSA